MPEACSCMLDSRPPSATTKHRPFNKTAGMSTPLVPIQTRSTRVQERGKNFGNRLWTILRKKVEPQAEATFFQEMSPSMLSGWGERPRYTFFFVLGLSGNIFRKHTSLKLRHDLFPEDVSKQALRLKSAQKREHVWLLTLWIHFSGKCHHASSRLGRELRNEKIFVWGLSGYIFRKSCGLRRDLSPGHVSKQISG